MLYRLLIYTSHFVKVQYFEMFLLANFMSKRKHSKFLNQNRFYEACHLLHKKANLNIAKCLQFHMNIIFSFDTLYEILNFRFGLIF